MSKRFSGISLSAAAYLGAASFGSEGRGITPSMNGFASFVCPSMFKTNGLVADDARNILAVHDGGLSVLHNQEFDVNTEVEIPARY